MIVARYSFGYYGSIIPSVLNLITFMGFLILNLILGGQTLAAVSGTNGDGLNWDVGIAIVAVIALLVSPVNPTLPEVEPEYWYLRRSHFVGTRYSTPTSDSHGSLS